MSQTDRIEKDLIGEKSVPADAYYGVQAARAMDNFHISGIQISQYPDLIRGFAMVKIAAAKANHFCGVLEQDKCDAIVAACKEIIAGKLHDQFLIDVVQGGAGTSTNMNANEVIANRALELMGHKKGEYQYCDPNDDVNRSQSTNDAYPSSLRLAIYMSNKKLVAEIKSLIGSFETKGDEFADVLKMGRTQLQDAVPMTLGQEFNAWGASLRGEANALEFVQDTLLSVNMGATAIGTGLNAPKGFSEKCIEYLREITRENFRLAKNLVEATQDTQAFVLYSSCLKSLAIKLSKICNDLRLLASGPRAGLNEINLPGIQPGSSIMPGKVNPVIPEVVNQVCFKAIGNDLTVTLAAEAGQLELNVMEPVMVHCILDSQTMFMNAAQTLRENCINAITANRNACAQHISKSVGVVTALVPYIGYHKCSELAKEALQTGRGIIELIQEKKILDDDELAKILDPKSMSGI